MNTEIKANTVSINRLAKFKTVGQSRLYGTSPINYSSIINKLKRPYTTQINDRTVIQKRLDFYTTVRYLY